MQQAVSMQLRQPLWPRVYFCLFPPRFVSKKRLCLDPAYCLLCGVRMLCFFLKSAANSVLCCAGPCAGHGMEVEQCAGGRSCRRINPAVSGLHGSFLYTGMVEGCGACFRSDVYSDHQHISTGGSLLCSVRHDFPFGILCSPDVLPEGCENDSQIIFYLASRTAP